MFERNEMFYFNYLIKNNFVEAPSAPQKFTVDKVTDKDVSLTWRAPKSDGGSRIKQYKVFKKSDKPGSVWTDVGVVDSFKTNITVPDLSHDEKYTFSIMAENEMGLGEMAETDRPVKLEKLISKYSFNEI